MYRQNYLNDSKASIEYSNNTNNIYKTLKTKPCKKTTNYILVTYNI